MDQEEKKNELGLSDAALTDFLHGSGGIDIRDAFTKDIYLTRQVIVGMRFQGGADGLLRDLKPGDCVTFLREPDNRFDQKAVAAVDAHGQKLGYIPRNQNEVVSALLDAGKSFYGIVPEKEEMFGRLTGGQTEGSGIPRELYVDLYMREFTGPEDLHELPRQGSEGSYLVISVSAEAAGEEPGALRSICAVKVINGERRDYFYSGGSEMADGSADAYELAEAFSQFAGYLPVVGHGIEGGTEKAIADLYGICLGIPFSNRVIDTRAMAQEHLPDLEDYSLDALDGELGLYFGEGKEQSPEAHETAGPDLNDDAAERERDCLMTWELYRRLDRSFLSRRRYGEELRMTPIWDFYDKELIDVHLYDALEEERFILLGDVMDRSERDFLKNGRFTCGMIEDLRRILEEYGTEFSKEDYAPDKVTMNLPGSLSDFEYEAQKLLLEQLSENEQLAFEDLYWQERSAVLNGVLGYLLALSFLDGDDHQTMLLLLIGAVTVYRGDYSEAGFAMLEGAHGMEQDVTNGYLVLAKFYDDWHAGRLLPEAYPGMVRVCECLGRGILTGKIMEEADEETRAGAGAALFREAVFHASRNIRSEEAEQAVINIGRCFSGLKLRPDDGEMTFPGIEKDPETAYKAFYHAMYSGMPGKEDAAEYAELLLREYGHRL